jgi:Zn-dependent metalloprotease
VLLRNNIDNLGGPMRSTVNCVRIKRSAGGNEWANAFWNGTQAVYGQRVNGTTLLSVASDLAVVAHEIVHGVTQHSSRLEYALQSGALNESFSDVFGVIVANFPNRNVKTWDWVIGRGLGSSGNPFRDLSNPPAFGQPEHLRDFVDRPVTVAGDFGAVHMNSGIPNKAAYNVMTSRTARGSLHFKPSEAAALFYLALTQNLSHTSNFVDCRNAVVRVALTMFRKMPKATRNAKIRAIEKAYDEVGIQ